MNGETVTVVRRGAQTGEDRYGKPIYGPDQEIPVAGCMVAPRSSAEPDEVGRGAVITGVTVYLPPGADVRPQDRLRIRGELFQVDGDAGDWSSGYTAWRPGVEVAAERVEG